MMNRPLIIIALCALPFAVRAEGPAAPMAGAPAATDDAADGPLVVIDAGHGGSNTGAPGVTGEVHEKHVTIKLAQTLALRLSQLGYRIETTRDSDVYLTLRQRAEYANRRGADLFLSIHANATPNHAQRGYETYVLSQRAIDVDARALRMGSGRPRPDLDADVAAILEDVERGLAQPMAATLAARIQRELRTVRDPADDRGVKQESMHVLLGADMPAVLVEVGFVDHVLEGQELLDLAVQSDICDALVRALVATLPPK